MSTSPLVELLGPSLLTRVGLKKSTKELFQDKDLVMLYFSASWCGPCKAFTPLLTKFYNSCAKEAKLEIVFVSSDRDVASFNEYYEKMPWLAIPTDQGTAAVKNNLANSLQIMGIPTVIVLDVKTGNYITDQAREEVMSKGDTKESGLNLVEEWKKIESVPMEEAAAKRKESMPQRGMLMTVIMYIAKNPMYIFGLIYLYRQLLKYLKTKTGAPEMIEEETMSNGQEF